MSVQLVASLVVGGGWRLEANQTPSEKAVVFQAYKLSFCAYGPKY